MDNKKISRRDFIKGAAASTIGIGATGVLISCSGLQKPAGLYTPGTYSATAKGIGKVEATLTFSTEKITKVDLDLSGETETIGQAAKDQLIKSIMDAQSSEIDAISGASITATAVKEAVAKCIAQAKGVVIPTSVAAEDTSSADWLGKEPEISDSEIKDTWTTDLLIVGAGNAGLVAAAKAADLGLKFRIIESMGNVAEERGFVAAINSKYTKAAKTEVDLGLWLSEFTRYNSGKCNPRVVKAFINNSAEMIEYVAGVVDKYGFDTITGFDSWPKMDHTTSYYCPPQEHRFVPRPDSKFASMTRNDILADYISKKGQPVDFSTALVKLVKNGDAVTGAIAEGKKGYIRINAQNVLLTCGGYGANEKMMVALQPLTSQVLVSSMAYPGDKGQGIKAALWAGAEKDVEPAPMIFDRGIVEPGVNAGFIKEADGSYSLPGGHITTKIEYNPGTQPFLKVNRQGVRFANESCPYNDIVHSASYQPGRVYCQVFDADYRKYWEQFHTTGCSSLPRLIPDAFIKMVEGYAEKGIIKKASSLEELADKLGFTGKDKEVFLATCARQNENFINGTDPDFYKPKLRLSALKSAPFYGVWMGGNLLCTGDGIKTNEHMQALNSMAEVVPGLYCAGNNAGSFFSGNYPCLYGGTAAGRSLTGAYTAVKNIAKA